MTPLVEGWKVLTHDGRLPLPGSPVVWTGAMREELNGLDLSSCGWAFHAELPTAVGLSGLWPLGRPAVVVRVNVPGGVNFIRSDDFMFARRVCVLEAAADEEVDAAIDVLSARFEEFAVDMAHEQKEWRRALGRPDSSPDVVHASLRETLRSRGLTGWRLEQMGSGAMVWKAWGSFAMSDRAAAVAARADFGVKDAFEARDAWLAHRHLDADWRAWDPWTTLPGEFKSDPKAPLAHRDLGTARAAFAAHFALTVRFAASMGWTRQRLDVLSLGLRDAYASGLEIAHPIGPRLLGWAVR